MSLRHRVDVIYTCEFAGSVVLVVHGVMGMVLLENMKVIWIAQMLSIYSKLAFVAYILIAVIRVSYFVDIVPLLQPASSDQQIDSSLEWFTSMLTVNVQNQTWALVLTIALLLAYGTCFMFDLCLVSLCKNLIRTVRDYEAKTKKNND